MQFYLIVAATFALTFSAGAAPNRAVVSFSQGDFACVGSFLEAKPEEAQPLLTLTRCLDNFHSGGVELKTARGEVIRSQDVAVHPSLIESKQADPGKTSSELGLAVVFFPSGTRERMGGATAQVAKTLPTEATSLLIGGAGQSVAQIPGTPVWDKEGHIVALMAECPAKALDGSETFCPTISLFTEASRSTLLSARNSDQYAMGEVSVPDTTHELGLFFRRQHCQQTCQPVQPYYCRPVPQPQYPQCAPRYQPAAPAPVAPPAPAPVAPPAPSVKSAPAPRVITNANIQNANISNSIIVNSTIHNSNLPNSSLHNSTISNSNLPNSRVTNANVHNSRLPNSSITRSNLYNSAAPNSSFQNTNGYNSSAPNSNFRESTFYNSNVSSPSYYRSASYQSVPAQPRPTQVAAAEPIHVVASPPPPPPPPPYNGMYDTAANRPARLTSSTLEGQVASSVRQLEGRTSAQANLVASTRVPLLKGESNTTHASTLTLLAKGEPASKAPVSPTEKAIETDKTLLAQSQK